jgi:hypothetical protein
MNDNDLITSVQQSVADVHMHVPVEQILRRGRAARARRLIPGGVAALAAAAGAALAATALTPPSHQPAAQLAAWTVTKLAHGNIRVTIRELKDPAGLQRTLRADGVPASVTFVARQNPACRPYPASAARLKKVFPVPYRDFPPRKGAPHSVPVTGTNALPKGHTVVIVIHPAALPGTAGVQIAVSDTGPHGTLAVDFPGLVYAIPQCTGS